MVRCEVGEGEYRWSKAASVVGPEEMTILSLDL